MHEVLSHLLDDPENAHHLRALGDVGALVGEALVAPVAMLNPATITLTGALAVRSVRDRIDERLSLEQRFGSDPEIVMLAEQENKFIRAKGAALALIRREVHRRLPELLEEDKFTTTQRVKALTQRFGTNPL